MDEFWILAILQAGVEHSSLFLLWAIMATDTISMFMVDFIQNNLDCNYNN